MVTSQVELDVMTGARALLDVVCAAAGIRLDDQQRIRALVGIDAELTDLRHQWLAPVRAELDEMNRVLTEARADISAALRLVDNL